MTYNMLSALTLKLGTSALIFSFGSVYIIGLYLL